MKDKALNVLNFCRLIDEHGTLSLTNIAVIIVLGKVAIAPTTDLEGMAALLTAISAYNFKRWLSSRAKPAGVDRLKELEEKLNRIAFAAGMKKKV